MVVPVLSNNQIVYWHWFMPWLHWKCGNTTG